MISNDHPFLTCALSTDDARPALTYLGTNGRSLCATDGHRAHIVEVNPGAPEGTWKIVDPAPEHADLTYPTIDVLLDSLPKTGRIKVALDADQRRHLRLLCAMADGLNRQHKKEWARTPKKSRPEAPQKAFIAFHASGEGNEHLWADLLIGEAPGIIPPTEQVASGCWDISRVVDLGAVAVVDLVWGVDADYLVDVLDTLPVASELAITSTNPYRVETVPADTLTVELRDGYTAGRFYVTSRPQDFALVMPVRV